MERALELIAAAAPAFGSGVTETSETRLGLDVCVATRTGGEVFFPMVAETVGEHEILVREDRAKSQRLPACCPERHINGDGSLCLFWASGDDAVVVRDEQSAMEWWSALIKHLDGQLYADKHRRWAGRARAHGDAAVHQARAEGAAAAFGPEMARALRQGHLTLVPGETHRWVPGTSVRLTLDGIRVFATVIGKGKVANQRGPCVKSLAITTP